MCVAPHQHYILSWKGAMSVIGSKENMRRCAVVFDSAAKLISLVNYRGSSCSAEGYSSKSDIEQNHATVVR